MTVKAHTLLILGAVLGVLAFSASPAFAESPWWHLSSASRPTYLKPGRAEGIILVTASNLGDAPANPATQPITLTDVLPPELEAVGIEAEADENLFRDNDNELECSLRSLSCTFTGQNDYLKLVEPYEQIQMRIIVKVKPGAKECEPDASTCEVNTASITGGEAPAATARRAVTVNGSPIPYGMSTYEQRAEEEGGGLDTQAGSHPFQYTTTLAFNETWEGREPLNGDPVALTKDLHFKLPVGLVGNPTPFAQCNIAVFLQGNEYACPDASILGASRTLITVHIGKFWKQVPWVAPLYNLVPVAGEPARFGFKVHGVPIILDTAVRTGEDNGVTVSVTNISEEAEFVGSEVTFWGVPADERHRDERGECLSSQHISATNNFCPSLEELRPPPFLVLPTSCTGPLRTTLEYDSWLEPNNVLSIGNTALMPSLDGCNRLPFEPSIKVTPDAQAASSPTGLNVDVHVNQESVLSGKGLAQSDVKNITVALPAGVAINPAGGDGLEACSEGLVGFTGVKELDPVSEPGVETPQFTPYLPGSLAAAAAGDSEPLLPGVNFCANASKIGEVTIKSPLLPNPLKGFVYLAAQESNPFGSLVAMYILAEDPVSGVLVKLVGEVQLCKGAGEVIAGDTCQALGQIISTVDNNPQLPFEDAELHFFGGERAPLTSPTRCGSYTTQASFAPWSGSEPVGASSTFDVTSGPKTLSEPGGSPCPGASLPFSPSLTGGALSVNAGAFSPFDATFSRQNGEQNMQSVEVHLPPGLSGILAGVELCPEPQANLGECGPNSLIGEATVSVGVGGEPYTVSGGKFYLTGPYNGTGGCTVGTSGCAPFGLTFEVPAKAGPFDLADTKANHPACDCVLVRGKVEINPITTALRITSNPPGSPDAIPTSIEGIPLEIQHVNATTTRPDFQFNPTNCSKMEVTGTIHSSENATDTIGVPFQVTNCAALKFEPKLAVSTSAKTSRADGASLHVLLTYPYARFGSYANVAKVKVELPKQLPSRLTTLQKACSNAQFEANPAGCPPASVIGHAKAITDAIPVPLEGPAIFVSHGGEAFPSLVIVLQGYGVTVDLVGSTFINEKTGVTSSTFKTVPDQPVGSFELTLPEGKYSALAATANLCKQKLSMPTEFVAQNGAEIHESTKIAVTGCPKTVRHERKKKRRHRKKK